VLELGEAAEDDSTSGGPREGSASGRNLEGPPTARSADSAADSETEGALPVKRVCELARSNHTETAYNRRTAERP